MGGCSVQHRARSLEMATTTTEEQEKLLQFAIDFALTGTYTSLDELTSDKRTDKKRAILFGLHLLYYSVQLCCVPMSSA